MRVKRRFALITLSSLASSGNHHVLPNLNSTSSLSLANKANTWNLVIGVICGVG